MPGAGAGVQVRRRRQGVRVQGGRTDHGADRFAPFGGQNASIGGFGDSRGPGGAPGMNGIEGVLDERSEGAEKFFGKSARV